MILLITDGKPCIVRPIVCQVDRNVTFIELTPDQYPPAFTTMLEDRRLECAVIECFLNMRRCLELLRVIKKQRPDVPVIFVVLSGSDHVIVKTLSSGARYCFTKPLDASRFHDRIRMLLELKRLSRERRIPLLAADPKQEKSTGIAPDVSDNILRTLHYIEDHPGRRDLSIERLARIACMSPFHFCRVFKKHTNKSPMRFVDHVRIEKAKEFLASSSGSMSISLIATTVGFNDSSSFNKHFKKATGLTPSGFKLQRKSIRSTQSPSRNPEQNYRKN